MSDLPAGADIVPVTQALRLKLADESLRHAIAIANDGNTMWYLVVGDVPQDRMKPTWVAEHDVTASFIGNGRR